MTFFCFFRPGLGAADWGEAACEDCSPRDRCGGRGERRSRWREQTTNTREQNDKQHTKNKEQKSSGDACAPFWWNQGPT